MQMTDDEIRSSMRKAKNPGEQVKVLAELNACGESEVRAKLEQLGIEIPATKPKTWKFDTSRASQLLAEGKTDLEAAEMLGITKLTFSSWRRAMGLPINSEPRRAPRRRQAAPGPDPAVPASEDPGTAGPGPGCAGLRRSRHNDRCTHGGDLLPAGQMAPGCGRIFQRAGHPAGGACEYLRGHWGAGTSRAD